MITTGSKFAFALAALLAFTAVVYGYTTGGGEIGPISVGYKGAGGDHIGYTLLLFGAAVSAFIGFALTAFRDADPEAGAALTGQQPVAAPVPGASYWPAIAAAGVAFTVVGVVLNNVFFVAGLIALGVVAIEWTMQTWADRATGDPAVNKEIRDRVMLPIEAPIGGAIVIAAVVGGFSRVFLTASSAAAVWIALAIAAVIFAAGTLLSVQKDLRKDLVAGLLVIAAIVTIGLGIFGAVRGERDFEHHGDHPAGTSEGEHDAAVVEESNQ